ncbi:MAG: condensation domain-containing protein, partial [Nostoc sp.]
DLKFSIWESPEGYNGSLEYKTDLFDAKTIARMIDNFEILLRNVVEYPDINLNELVKILAASEKEQQQSKEKQLEYTSLEKLKMTKRKSISRV